MITQTWALLLDAYRDLNARKLFWITLILSGVFIGGFALLGADPRGFKLLWWRWDMPMAEFVYKQVFSYLIVGLWLTFVAAILAIISTAGMFPDLLSSGAIDLYLAKPLGRVRLFFTKYITGLLFVALQVALVAVGGFLLLGFRGREWKPGLLLAIPIVLCFFSYLFSVCVLLGVATRSTIAALLLTIVCWGGFWVVHKAEFELFKSRVAQEYLANFYQDEVRKADARIAELQSHPGAASDASEMSDLRRQRDSDQQQYVGIQRTAGTVRTIHRVFYVIKSLVPKTTETTDLLDRILFTNAEVASADRQKLSWLPGGQRDREMSAQFRAAQEAAIQSDQAVRSRSIAWVIGTSLAFEAVVLALAAWIFCRRDY